jgi:hypothetical protein
MHLAFLAERKIHVGSAVNAAPQGKSVLATAVRVLQNRLGANQRF